MRSLPLHPHAALKILKGYPWVYAKDILLKSLPDIPNGELVILVNEQHTPLAVGYYNKQSKVCCRVLSRDANTVIDEAFFTAKFQQALAYREQHFSSPYYRLIYAEGDQLPGLIIDRFADTLVCQTSTAGMEKLKPQWLAALQACVNPTRLLLRDDVPSRLKEGLPLSVTAVVGEKEGLIVLSENNTHFYVDPINGQKTGWFYDQRINRLWLAQRAKHKTVLDLYSYCGGFGLTAANHGAKEVTLIDASQSALHFAEKAAQLNGLNQCRFIHDDLFKLLPQWQAAEVQFDIVIADPPAFVKQAKDKGPGLRGYQKLAKLTAALVKPQGMLFIASCSHHASNSEFRHAVEIGISKAGRTARLLRKGGTGRDHPVNPLLAENHYLKSLTYQLS